MASGKEIRTKIKSIRNTQKVTRALEMVSASKIRKAQDQMSASRPYANSIRHVIGHMAKGHLEYQHKYLDRRSEKRVGVIVVSTDRSLCGGLNINLFRKLVGKMEEWAKTNVEVDLAVVGTKGESFFRRLGVNIVAATQHIGEQPEVGSLIGTVKVLFDKFAADELSHVYIAYNQFVNTITQKATLAPLLPLPLSKDENLNYYWDYIYEPGSQFLIDSLVVRYVESQVYQAAVENIACEHAARMVAMKAASDNAGELIHEFQLAYNKARQAAITQELSEIVGGAAAV